MSGYTRIYVDSRRRISGTSSDFIYQLAWPIDVPQSRVFVDSVQIPNTFPAIPTANRHVYLEETTAAVRQLDDMSLYRVTLHDPVSVEIHLGYFGPRRI